MNSPLDLRFVLVFALEGDEEDDEDAVLRFRVEAHDQYGRLLTATEVQDVEVGAGYALPIGQLSQEARRASLQGTEETSHTPRPDPGLMKFLH